MVALHIPSPSAPSTRTAAQLARAAESREAAQYDAILVGRFVDGDEAAFTEIVARYREKMLHVAFRRLNNHADAEEIVQDTFIRAHRGLAKFRGESSLAAWLYRIAVNLSCNRHWYFFRRQRHTTLSLDAPVNDDSDSTLASVIPSENATAVQEACRNEFASLLTACIARLPAPQRDILVLRGVQQHSYMHIARSLGIRVGTAKSRIGRARHALRALLGQTHPELRNQALSLACFEPASTAPALAVA
jgi:RNA polymerase sigma-70 factor (ECF subfamily)